jgi:hypothetical protein
MKRSTVVATLTFIALLLPSAALARRDEVVRTSSPHIAKTAQAAKTYQSATTSQSAKTSQDKAYSSRAPHW